MMQIEEILSKRSNAKAKHQLWHSLYEDVYSLFMPERNLYETTSEGTDRTYQVYSSAGVKAADNFVNKMQQSIVPSNLKWMKLEAGPLIPNEAKNDVNAFLENVTDLFFHIVHSSNFDISTQEFFYDLFVGTACLLIQKGKDKNNPISYVAIPNKNVFFEEGIDKKIDTIFREFKLKNELIKRQWDDADYTPSPKEKTTEKELLECTYYDYDLEKWIYSVILMEKKEKIVERKLNTNPWVITRWSVTPEETNGRGPAIKALPDMKMLNKIKEYSIRNFALKLYPPFTAADDGILDPDKFVIDPGAINIVERNGGPNGPSIAPLPVGGDVNLEQFQMEETKMDIKNITFDTQLPSLSGPVRSATEIAERIRDLQIDIGAAFGRIMKEMIRPIVIRSIDILMQSGFIPKDPQTNKAIFNIKDLDEYLIKIKITSPIAKQQDLEELQSISNAIQLSYNINPEIAQSVYKIDEMLEYIGQKSGVPAKFLRNKQDRDTYLQNIQSQINNQKEQELTQETQAEVIKNESRK